MRAKAKTTVKVPQCVVLDFETEGIEQRPDYPPKPVGFAIKFPKDKKAKYYAFGHPEGNNCRESQAKKILAKAWKSKYPLLGQHMKFDVDVAQTHMGMDPLPWQRIHDTLYLLFLYEPHADSLSLKPSAERILKVKPKERDALREWVLKHVPEAKRKKKEWGKYICRAPGGLVGRYAADGDAGSTLKLFEKLYPYIVEHGMLEAYDRERKLMPILLENEFEGVRVDLPRLEKDVAIYQAALKRADAWLRKRLGVAELNIDSDREFANALENSGVVTNFALTPKGQKSVSKKNLTVDRFDDWKVASVYGYRNRLQTCLGMFMLPWLRMARVAGAKGTGWVHTNWNQVRQSHGAEKLVGARTGRLSSNPNFQNLVKNWKKAFIDGYRHPKFLRGIPELPLLRVYFLPDRDDHVWCRRDQNQQELRILAHFEGGELMERYQNDPRLDIHALVGQTIKEMLGVDLPRDPVKILNFADIYGRGLGTLAESMGVDVITAKKFRQVKNELLPGIQDLIATLKERTTAGKPFRTWGGREYHVEKPKFVKKFNRIMDFHYKCLNYLVQGSGSDITKEIVIRYSNHPDKKGRLLLTVHDEFDISVNKKYVKQEMELLRGIIRGLALDVIMESDGETGPSWGALKAFEDAKPKAMRASA